MTLVYISKLTNHLLLQTGTVAIQFSFICFSVYLFEMSRYLCKRLRRKNEGFRIKVEGR